MNKVYFNSLNELSSKGYYPMTDEDKEIILDALYRGKALYYDDKLNVYTDDTGAQIASLY